MDNLNLTLDFRDTNLINESKSSNLALDIPLCLVICLVNTLAVVAIRRKDTNGLNNLLIANCIVNILKCPIGQNCKMCQDIHTKNIFRGLCQ